MSLPNKPTLVAAVLYALSDPKGVNGKQPLLWTEIPEASKTSYLKLADFLGQYVVGSQPQDVDRGKLAGVLHSMIKGTPAEGLNADHAVTVFLTLMHLMP